ncbi:MAG: cation transporter [Nitrospira sp.]|nr:cation transporter [Nitrospira sp.]MBA3754043.1 cation transporter [Nitrospira sp.]
MIVEECLKTCTDLLGQGSFLIQNMVCEGCTTKITEALQAIPGVREVSRRFRKNTFTCSTSRRRFRWNSSRRSLERRDLRRLTPGWRTGNPSGLFIPSGSSITRPIFTS